MKRLNYEQRTLIEGHLADDTPLREIARALRVSPSTVSREVGRNGGRHGYRAAAAQARAAEQRARVGPPEVSQWAFVAACLWLTHRASPEQIAAIAKPEWAISASTIRRRIAEDRRTNGTLYKLLRLRGKRRISKAERAKQGCNHIRNRKHFSLRPPGARFRSELGHWEGDTIMDPNSQHRTGCLILVDRASRQVLLYPLPQLKAPAVADAVIALLRNTGARSITFDNGGEFAHHWRMAEKLGIPTFFTDPASPHQRGTCENAVFLVRDIVNWQPVGKWSPECLRGLAEIINNRPMKLHGWHSRNQAAKKIGRNQV